MALRSKFRGVWHYSSATIWVGQEQTGRSPSEILVSAALYAKSAESLAERREGLAASLEGVADKEAAQARLSADQNQGPPPSAALAKASEKTPKARKTRGATGQTKFLQKGISR